MGAKEQVKRERRIERRTQPLIHRTSVLATPALVEPPMSWVDRYAGMDAAEMAVALGIDNARRALRTAPRNRTLFDDEDERPTQRRAPAPVVPEEPVAVVDGIAFHVAVERARAAGRCSMSIEQIAEALSNEHRPVNLHEIQRRNMRR